MAEGLELDEAAGLGQPGRGGPQVVELGDKPGDRLGVVGVEKVGGEPLDQVAEVGAVGLPDGQSLVGLGQPVGGVLAEGLQEPVAAGRGVVLDKRTFHQVHHGLDDVDRVTGAGHPLGCFEVEGAGEHRQTAEHPSLLLTQELMGPGDRGLEGPVALLGLPTGGQESEPLPPGAGRSRSGSWPAPGPPPPSVAHRPAPSSLVWPAVSAVFSSLFRTGEIK